MGQFWRRHAVTVPSAASRRGTRFLALLLAGSCFSAWDAASVIAQGTRSRPISLSTDDRRQMMDDFSSSLYRAEEQRFDDRLQYDMQRMGPLYDASRVTPEMQKLRPLVTAAAREGSRLVRFLDDDSRINPGLRLLLSDAYKLNARVQVLAQKVQQVSDQRLIDEEFRTLDAGWRELGYKLARTRDLSQDTQTSLASIEDLARQIADILQISPQVDSRQMLQKTTTLAADLRTLYEDIGYEMGRTPNANTLLMGVSRIRRSVDDFSNLIRDGYDRQQLVTEYQRFQQQWYPLAQQLQAVGNRTIDRSLRRITLTDNEIHSLLLLPPQGDKQQLLYLTGVLRKDIDEFFQRTPLSLLIHLPNSERALATADQFYGVCEHFIDTVNNPVGGQTQDQDLIDAFRYIEDAEQSFSQTFRGVKSTAALAVLQQIEQTIDTLRQVLQIQSNEFDRSQAIDLAADVANMTDDLDRVVRRWLQTERPTFASDCLREVDALADASANLQRKLYSSSSLVEIGRDSEALYENWRRVYNYLVMCKTEDRRELGRISTRLTPALFQLRTMLVQ